MKKKVWIVFVSVAFFVFILLPWIIGCLVKYIPNLGTFGTEKDWFEFWQAYLGSTISIGGALSIFYLGRYYEKKKKFLERQKEIYGKFILKYFYTVSYLLSYELVGLGIDQKKSPKDIDILFSQTIRKMLNDTEYAALDLNKSLNKWRRTDFFFDLKGNIKESNQIEIAKDFYVQAFDVTTYLNANIFEDDFWIYFIILMFSELEDSSQEWYSGWKNISRGLYLYIESNRNGRKLATEIYQLRKDKRKLKKIYEEMKDKAHV